MKVIIGILLFAVSLCTVKSDSSHRVIKTILGKHMDSHPEEIFKVYHYLHKKDYDIHSEEGRSRYNVFHINLQKIREHNKQRRGFTLGLTPFADITNEEFKKMHIMNPQLFKINTKQMRFLSEDYVDFDSYQDDDEKESTSDKRQDDKKPIHIDHKEIMSPIRDQRMCGSCWAFSTAATIEAAYNAKSSTIDHVFSTQQLVDCDDKDQGCEGGYPGYALSYIKSVGLVKESDYPYTGEKGQCQVGSVKNTSKISSFLAVESKDSKKWLELLKRGPVVVGMDASSDEFQLYESGVIKAGHLECKESNHAVVAVGYSEVSGSKVITIRNSWSVAWGDEGYFQIEVDESTNTCGIQELAYLPVV